MEEFFVQSDSESEGEEDEDIIEEDNQQDYRYGANPQNDFQFNFGG